MRLYSAALLTLFVPALLFGQRIDTLTFYSKAFQQERVMLIQTPEFYKYQSAQVRLPVIYLLDGQHEWFVNPLISAIRYLQYTHEMPQALLVIIPLNERIQECEISSLDGPSTPLHKFITEDVESQLQAYRPNEYRLIIGHSFSASFAFYSHVKNPGYYSAAILNTPLDRFEELIQAVERNETSDHSKLSISIGGIAMDKDYHHRSAFDHLKLKYPSFFKSINTFEADHTAHNAVPIVTTPYFLTKVFSDFSSRYSKIAEVNQEYKLINQPESIEIELAKINAASKIGQYYYHPEIPDINGLASRYLASEFYEYGLAVYELGVSHFPEFYEFHLALYELYLPTNPSKARMHLHTAAELLERLEKDLPELHELLAEIEVEMKKNGW